MQLQHLLRKHPGGGGELYAFLLTDLMGKPTGGGKASPGSMGMAKAQAPLQPDKHHVVGAVDGACLKHNHLMKSLFLQIYKALYQSERTSTRPIFK
jgi:hypothetical protein